MCGPGPYLLDWDRYGELIWKKVVSLPNTNCRNNNNTTQAGAFYASRYHLPDTPTHTNKKKETYRSKTAI